MRKVGRNDLCPCGSGKKHKKCCMMKEKAKKHEDAVLHAHQGGVEKAVAWLSRRYNDEMNAWIEDVWLDRMELGVLESLSSTESEVMQINAMEMLLVEGRWVDELDEEIVFMDKVLGKGGPLMPVEQRQYLQSLQLAPLRLWEVTEVNAGVGLTLTDRLDESCVRYVQEKSASMQLHPWDVIGARPVQTPAGHWELSGGNYHFPRQHVEDLKERLKYECEIVTDGSERFAISQVIASTWLDLFVNPQPFMPNMTDAATGQSMLFVTEHYQVNDWDALEDQLDVIVDVDGDRKEGWHRFQLLDDDMCRSLVNINIGSKKNRIELFTKSRKGADEQQTWFEGIAGNVVRHLTREISDPSAMLARDDGNRKAPEPEIPDAVQKQLIHDYKRKYYTEWMDEPLPALDGEFAREAVKTEKGKNMVVALLKDFENMEASDPDPFDFSFLWKELGLNRPFDHG